MPEPIISPNSTDQATEIDPSYSNDDISGDLSEEVSEFHSPTREMDDSGQTNDEAENALDVKSFLSTINATIADSCLSAFVALGCTTSTDLDLLINLGDSTQKEWLDALSQYGVSLFQRVVIRDALLKRRQFKSEE